MTIGTGKTRGNGMLLIISGPSGVGKTSINRELVKRLGGVFSVSATTRPKTPEDTEGEDYYFLSDEEFDRMIEAGEFLEWAEVFDHRYGTPRKPVMENLQAGRLVIVEVDVRGAEQVKKAIPDAFGLFVLPPSEHDLLDRLRGRKREPEEVIQRRFAEAQREIAQARTNGVYDVFIVNRDLPAAIEQACDIVEAEMKKRS